MRIRSATLDDVAAIRKLAVDTEMFGPDDVDFVDEMVGGFVDGSLADHRWTVGVQDGRLVAAAYSAPEPFADRVWNLYFLAVDPSAQGTGAGSALIDDLESELRHRGPDMAQVLVVETSSTERYASTRDFYARRGFVEEARIRRYYGPGDDKVVFWKSLTGDWHLTGD